MEYGALSIAFARNAYVGPLAALTAAVVARVDCGLMDVLFGGAVLRPGDVSVTAPIPAAGTSIHSNTPVSESEVSASEKTAENVGVSVPTDTTPDPHATPATCK